MEKAHYENSGYAKLIANKFKGSTPKQTCRNIFDFIKSNIAYKIEPANLQTTKSLQRLISDGYGDCKHYSGLFAAILSACNIKYHYRFASYKADKTPTHVYVVAYDNQNNPIVCDAVLSSFGDEKPFTYKIDKNMLMHLSGFDSEYIGAKGPGKRIIKKVAQKVKKGAQKAGQKVKKVAQKAKVASKKVFKGAKKVGLAAPRVAFLGLVRLNVRGFATNITKAIQINPTKLKNLWEKLGGDFNKLKETARVGAKKKRIFGIEEENQIGLAVPAALTAATPIIVAIVPLLKQILPAKDTADLEKVAATASAGYEAATGQKISETAFTPESDMGVSPIEAAKKDNTIVSQEVMEGTKSPNQAALETEEAVMESATNQVQSGGFDSKKIMLIGAVAVGAFLLMNKKK